MLDNKDFDREQILEPMTIFKRKFLYNDGKFCLTPRMKEYLFGESSN